MLQSINKTDKDSHINKSATGTPDNFNIYGLYRRITDVSGIANEPCSCWWLVFYGRKQQIYLVDAYYIPCDLPCDDYMDNRIETHIRNLQLVENNANPIRKDEMYALVRQMRKQHHCIKVTDDIRPCFALEGDLRDYRSCDNPSDYDSSDVIRDVWLDDSCGHYSLVRKDALPDANAAIKTYCDKALYYNRQHAPSVYHADCHYETNQPDIAEQLETVQECNKRFAELQKAWTDCLDECDERIRKIAMQ